MKFHVLTLFPEMIRNGMNTSITGRAINAGILSVEAINIRDYAFNKHQKVDDYTYGGGAGMLMQAEPVYLAYEAIAEKAGKRPRVVYLTPQGQVFNQQMARDMAEEEDLVFLCGHYEGIDERVLEEIVTDYVSIGDYVLTGGELPAMVMMDSISRMVPGVLSNQESGETESFAGNLLEYPQYSRPEEWHGKKVPEVLMSGHHANIEKWRREQSIIRTARRRPDLLKKAGVDPASIQSFDDLYDASKTIVDGGFATYGIGFFANGAMFNVALGREGVQAYNNENGLNGQPVTECLYDSDTTVHDSIYNMLSIYQKMGAEKLCVPYGADYQSEIIPQMASGDCAMMMGVISMTTKVLDAAAGNFEVGVIPMPSASESGKRTGEPAAGTGTYVCDNGNEKAMQGAYEFIKFASTGEQAGYFASATGYIAPNQEAYDSAAYKTYREETFPGISVVYDSLAKSDSSATNPYVAISNEMRDANKVAMETAATDPTADINTVITTAKDSIQEALDIYNQSNS